MGRLKKSDGFFIINGSRYKEYNDFVKNGKTAIQIEKLIAKKFGGNPDWKAATSINFNVSYVVGKGLILIDCDTKESSEYIRKLNKKFNVQPYSYVSTPSQGKTHFWYRTNENSDNMIKTFKYAVSGKQTWMDGIDIRSFSYKKDPITKRNVITQGICFIRKTSKTESFHRPKPTEFEKNINKLLESDNFIPLVYLAPNKDNNNLKKLGGQYLKPMFEHKSGWINPTSNFKDRHEEEFIFVDMCKSLFNGGYFTNLEFCKEYIPQMLILNDDTNRMLDDYHIEDMWNNAKAEHLIKKDEEQRLQAIDKVIKDCGFYYFRNNFYLTKRIINPKTKEVYENVIVNADSLWNSKKLRDENMNMQIKEKAPWWKPVKTIGRGQIVEIKDKWSILRPIVSWKNEENFIKCITFSNGYVDKFGFHPNKIAGFTTTQIIRNYKGKVPVIPEVHKLLFYIFGEHVKKGLTFLSYILANHSLRVALFLRSRGGAGKTWIMNYLTSLIGINNSGEVDGVKAFEKGDKFAWSDIIDKSFVNIDEPGTNPIGSALEAFKGHIDTKPNVKVEKKNENMKLVPNTQTYIFTLNKMFKIPPWNLECWDRIAFRFMDENSKYKLTYKELEILESEAAINYFIYILVQAYIQDRQKDHILNKDFVMDNESEKQAIIKRDKYYNRIIKSEGPIDVEHLCNQSGRKKLDENIMEEWLIYLGYKEKDLLWYDPSVNFDNKK